ncbi:MAG: hypothetical protein QM784_13205 [Polyangiaceae bacterium]
MPISQINRASGQVFMRGTIASLNRAGALDGVNATNQVNVVENVTAPEAPLREGTSSSTSTGRRTTVVASRREGPAQATEGEVRTSSGRPASESSFPRKAATNVFADDTSGQPPFGHLDLKA